jgi:soluble lytic murein transglycosylase
MHDLERQRQDYLVASRMIRLGRTKVFKRYIRRLRKYPLYPYLEYRYLKLGLRNIPDKEVLSFIRKYRGTHLAGRLKRLLLIKYARKQQWRLFLKHYKPGNSILLQCYQRQAWLALGNRKSAFKQMDSLWLSGYSLPDSCDRVIHAWQQSGNLSRRLVWIRFRLAMEYRNPKLARFLATRYLRGKEQKVALKWYRLYRRPGLVLRFRYLDHRHPQFQNIVRHTMYRLAWINPEEAIRILGRLENKYSLKPKLIHGIHKRIALSLARTHHKAALKWLNRLPSTYSDDKVLSWKIRLNMLAGNWKSVLASINKLHPDIRSKDTWQYWLARSLEAQARQKSALAIYRKLARKRSFTGFMSSDRLGLKYSFQEKKLTYSKKKLQAFQQLAGIQRARELYKLGDVTNARREWLHTISHMSRQQVRLAAITAHQWQWHERAIHALAMIKDYHDISIRFPIVHEKQVFRIARKYDLDPALILGVIRRESAFSKDARSHKGALGLMQLLPSTAREIARLFRLRLGHKYNLFKPATNIRYGARHLSLLAGRFDYHIPMMLAAYNAGSYRVKSWLPDKPVSADIWIESIPFRETRNYVKNILAYIIIYEYKLGYKTRDRIGYLTPEVPARSR